MDSTESIPETPVSNDACSLNQIENEEKIEQEIRSLIQDEEMPLAIETVLNEGTDKMDCTEVEPLDELVGDALNKEEKTPEPNLTANLEEQEQCIDISDKQEHSTAHEDKYEHSVDKQDQSVEDSNKQEPSKGDLDMKECSIENVEPSTEDADKQESSIENSDKQEQPAEDSDKQEQSVEELDKQKHSIEDSDKQEHSVEELDKEKHSVEDSDKEEGSQKQEQPIENSDKQNQPSEDSNKEKEISDEIIKSVEEGVPEQTLAESENSNLETAEEFDKDENQKTDDSMLDTSTTQEKDKSDELGDSHFVECDKTIEDESFSDKNNEQEDVLATTKDILEQGTSSETVFVQVNTETEKLTDDNDVQKDIDFLEQDPIAADSFDHLSEDQEGGSEELCIIPDTERVISQAERDAASSIPPLRDITESNTSSDDESAESVNINIMQYHGDEEQNCSLPKCSSKNIPNYFYEDKSKITKYICDKVCLSSFLSSKPENLRISWDASIVVCGGKAIDKPFIPKPTIYKKRFCQNCKEVTKNMDKLLTWQMMDFCNEECLIKYQKENASMCSSCSKEVLLNCLGKYCVRFGQDIKQFCTSHCLEEYKKGLKLCSYCQKDMSDVTDGFLAPVGDKGQFKDFCGQKCMDKYDTMSNDSPPIKVDSGTKCNVCNSDSPIKFEFEWKSKNYYFCSDPCVTAFSFRNKVETGKCIICKKYTQQEILDKYTAYEDDTPISFCSSSCQNIYIAAHRKIVPCSWCKVKKYFFDMIRNYSKLGALVNLCSINCFNLFQESYCLSEKQSCYICENNTNVLYYLTTKDKSKYNICSYKCVLKFKENFPKENIESTALFNSSKEKTQSRKRSRTEENGENQEEDPIVGITTDNLSETEEGADEEIYIIPDTERIISQAEKDAASSIPPLREISQDITQSNAPVTNLIQPPIYVRKYDKDDPQSCSLPECNVMNRPVKYFYCKEGTTNEYICNDNCLKTFKTVFNERGVTCVWEESNLRVKNFSTGSTPKSSSPSTIANRVCAACAKETKDVENNLTWEIMDFCNEFCLTKYQKEIGSHCASCRCEVRSNSLGKYCVRFGNYIRQFCTSHCLEEYKRGLKVCSYCQQDMSNNSDGFLAPVGDKGQFKDFCSQSCMLKYDIMTNNRPPNVPDGTICSVCKSNKQITIEFEMKGDQNYFCGEPCFIAFRFVNNITTGKCSMCRRYFNQTVLDENTMFYDNTPHSFCSNSCKNIYIVAHRKIVPCSWCKVKKYNFDMIRRYSKSGPQVNMCSVNCLNLYHVSLSAVSAKKQPCHCCNKSSNAMYHLTMSDATVRNFCSYSCVMTFQNQFTKQPITLNLDSPVPAGAPRKNKKSRNDENGPSVASEVPGLPVITNVQSLASTNGNLPNSTQINTRSTRSKTNAMQSQIINNSNDLPVQIQVKQHFIVRPAPMPEQRNVGTLCTIRKANKSCNAKPVMVNKECQTDEREAKKILIPVPVPIYVPTPLHMFTAPVPMPVPFPLPIPIPIFIPTTRNSATGIMKEIKKIQVKIPSDPYEAELLMMAEMVAEEKKEENTDSESDVDDAVPADEGTFSPEPVDASNTFGDDMLQMALKMATELEEPAVDLEGALTANTITAPQGSEPATEESVDDPQPIHHLIDRPSLRGRKRGMRQSRGTGAKRGRRMSHQIDLPLMTSSAQSGPPPEPVEKPDANMCLKFTFGVNAWKQWVTTKNAELEKSSRRVKLFKTDILQLTSDELNYSLCLFVKEVRKPNGAEYAPDTIYYLCLGIQQYLFEHQRIDNIFCDPYYEKFTDCLDEVAKKFSVLYNDSHYIVTRVEEEHLWESKQLGAHSPHVLLSTLMFFNTKHFNLTTVDEHMQLSFSHIMKHWKRNPSQPSKVPGSRNVLLRFYPPQSAIQNNARKKKVYEQQENEDNPLRCPVKLYEFYLSKCPESVKTRNDVFYLQPERSCVPDSPVWYSTMPLPRDALEKMLHRVKMVKEINVALLTS